MERKNTFIKIHCVKIILMFFFLEHSIKKGAVCMCQFTFDPFLLSHCAHSNMILKVIHTHETHWHVCNACILIGLVGLKSHTSFIHQVLSDMNSWRKERLLSLSHPCAKPSHFVFWLKRIDIIAPVFRPSNEHPTNKQTEKKTQEHFFIDVIIW